MTTPTFSELDRAIEVAKEAAADWRDGSIPRSFPYRKFARALIAELLRGMDEPPLDPPAILGWDLAIKVIKRRARIGE
jgi:hypothetical protein